jgi:hypothetical protein
MSFDTTTPPTTQQTYIATKVSISPVTHDICINTLMGLPMEKEINDEYDIVKYVSRCLEAVKIIYNWASHRLKVRVGYNTPMLCDTKYNLFAVFKAIFDEFSSDEEEQRRAHRVVP